MLEIKLCSMTTPSWETFIKNIQDTLGISPTRGLDDAHQDINSPLAFLGSLDCNNNFKKALENYDNYRHIHIGLLSIATMDFQNILAGTPDIATKVISDKVQGVQGIYLCLNTASLYTWRRMILDYQNHPLVDYKLLSQKLLETFNQSKFKGIF